MNSRIRTYSELIRIPTFEERFHYLDLKGVVGEETFGFDRWINQQFYHSTEWRKLRRDIIVRDMGCDMGLRDYEIQGSIIIHHMNPITKLDILDSTEFLMDPEYLICVSDNTHKAIHYGDKNLLILAPIERSQFDTCPWRRV